MDFTEDSLSTGRRFRTLNVVDAFARECLLIEVDHSLPGPRVARLLEQLVERHGRPEVIRVDNGSESHWFALLRLRRREAQPRVARLRHR